MADEQYVPYPDRPRRVFDFVSGARARLLKFEKYVASSGSLDRLRTEDDWWEAFTVYDETVTWPVKEAKKDA
jgi:hypothetical protein